MLRFFIALWGAKFAAWVYKIIGRPNDLPGVLAVKICPDFLERIAKPKLVVTVTGTNGKTTTSHIVYNMLTSQGKKVSFNKGGANASAGFCLNLMRGVNIFNRPKVDASVLEADEKTLAESMSKIRPQYILVTNVCKDTLRRNAHPEYIFECIHNAFSILGESVTAILNANDPISSRLTENTGARTLYYGFTDIKSEPFDNIVKDITMCPYCAQDVKFNYRIYRHIGSFYCPDCGWHMPESDFYAKAVDFEKRVMTVTEKGRDTDYPLISGSIFNAFNVLSVIALFRALGYSEKTLIDFLSTQRITRIREDVVRYNDIDYYTYSAKGQNSSAVSTVFEYLVKEPSKKVLVFCLDELQDKNHPLETVTWLYETDCEFLQSDNITQIVVAGHMYLNHKLRLLLAGIPEEKIVAVEDARDVPDAVNTKGAQSVYILFDVDNVSEAFEWRDAIVNAAKRKNGEA